MELLDVFYKRYTGTIEAADYVEWASSHLYLDTLEVKKLAAMGTAGQLNIFEIEMMFDEVMEDTGEEPPSKRQCFDHHLKKLHAQLLLPNEHALSILRDIYKFTITHELFEEQMKWQEISDAADDFCYGDNFSGYSEERISEGILATARKLWNHSISNFNFEVFSGQKIMAVDSEANFIVQLEKGAIIIECPWRIRDVKGILIGETDVRSNSSEWRTVKDLLTGKKIQDIQLVENCPLLIVQCEGIFLDLFHASSFFDGWTLTDDDKVYLFSMHGGSIA